MEQKKNFTSHIANESYSSSNYIFQHSSQLSSSACEIRTDSFHSFLLKRTQFALNVSIIVTLARMNSELSILHQAHYYRAGRNKLASLQGLLDSFEITLS